MKACSRCREQKALIDFSPDAKALDGRASQCKPCQVLTTRAYRARNKDTLKFKQIAERYGIGRERYEELLEDQNNRCAICRVKFGDTRLTGPCVDHCHTSGVVRGLLCQNCNQALGLFKDSPISLFSAISYLTRESQP